MAEEALNHLSYRLAGLLCLAPGPPCNWRKTNIEREQSSAPTRPWAQGGGNPGPGAGGLPHLQTTQYPAKVGGRSEDPGVDEMLTENIINLVSADYIALHRPLFISRACSFILREFPLGGKAQLVFNFRAVFCSSLLAHQLKQIDRDPNNLLHCQFFLRSTSKVADL